MYSTVGTELETILNSLVATTTLATVVNYDIKTYDSFPTASISPIDSDEDFFDSALNQVNLKYRIRVADQNKNISTMEARMRTLCDNILIELRKSTNETLNGSVCRFTFTVNWGWMNDEHPMRTFEIIVNSEITPTI